MRRSLTIILALAFVQVAIGASEIEKLEKQKAKAEEELAEIRKDKQARADELSKKDEIVELRNKANEARTTYEKTLNTDEKVLAARKAQGEAGLLLNTVVQDAVAADKEGAALIKERKGLDGELMELDFDIRLDEYKLREIVRRRIEWIDEDVRAARQEAEKADRAFREKDLTDDDFKALRENINKTRAAYDELMRSDEIAAARERLAEAEAAYRKAEQEHVSASARSDAWQKYREVLDAKVAENADAVKLQEQLGEVRKNVETDRQRQAEIREELEKVRRRVVEEHADVKTARETADAAQQAARDAEQQEHLASLRAARDEAGRAYATQLRETIDGDDDVKECVEAERKLVEAIQAATERIKAIQLSEGIKLAKVKESKLEDGLAFDVFEWSAEAGAEPKYEELKAAKSGVATAVDIEARTRDEWYAIVYSGYLKIDKGGPYTFYLASDDGSELFISDTPVVSNLGMHGVVELSQQVDLEEGCYAVKITFYQGSGGHDLTFSWTTPGAEEKVPVPAEVLKHLPE